MKAWLEHGNFISRFLVQFHLISNFYEAIENPDAECFRPMAGLTVDGACMHEPIAANRYRADLAMPILSSLEAVAGRTLLPRARGESPAEWSLRAYLAPWVLLAHDGGLDPCFTYANRTAQTLFERPWADLVGLPSRYSAEPDAREARAALLERVRRDGYCDDYAGVRVAASGRRFRIAGATVWNLRDDLGHHRGQAAQFSQWTYLDH